MKLCVLFGEPDVGTLQRRIDSRAFAEWCAYLRLHPTGDDWQQTGTIASTMVNMWSDGKAKATEPGDFVPAWKPPKPPMRGDDMAAIFKAIVVSQYGVTQ